MDIFTMSQKACMRMEQSLMLLAEERPSHKGLHDMDSHKIYIYTFFDHISVVFCVRIDLSVYLSLYQGFPPGTKTAMLLPFNKI